MSPLVVSQDKYSHSISCVSISPLTASHIISFEVSCLIKISPLAVFAENFVVLPVANSISPLAAESAIISFAFVNNTLISPLADSTVNSSVSKSSMKTSPLAVFNSVVVGKNYHAGRCFDVGDVGFVVAFERSRDDDKISVTDLRFGVSF